MKNTKFLIALIFIVAGVALRFLNIAPNFSPLYAIALFGGTHLTNSWKKYALILSTIWTSDIILNNLVYTEYFKEFTLFHGISLFNYIAFALMIFLGSLIKKTNQFNVILSLIGGSLIFFILSNFGVWINPTSQMYTKDLKGLINCYVMGIPYFKSTLSSTILFGGILYSTYHFTIKEAQKLRLSN